MRRVPEADRALGRDHERPDLRGPAHVRPAAELARVARDLDDAHLVAVLLAEQHHRAELLRLLDRRHERVDGEVLEDLLVDAALDLLALVRGERLRVREVEAELVGANGRARLADVVAEDVLERLVQEMRRGVVGHGREAGVPVDDSADTIALGEALALEGQDLLVTEPIGGAENRSRARLLVLEVALVGDLAAAFRIERRIVELRLEEALVDLLVRGDRGQDVELLVAHEARLRAADVRDLPRLGRLRDDTVLGHPARELFLVDRQPALGGQLPGELDREAVRRGERERVVAADRSAARQSLRRASCRARGSARNALPRP